MGTNMYPSSSLLGDHKDQLIAALPVDELIEKADGFAGVFPGNQLTNFWVVYHLKLNQIKTLAKKGTSHTS